MRLIDADELKERILIDSDLVEVYDGVMVPCIDFEYNIDNAPTIEAIPIKVIKDFLRCEKIDSCEWLNCSECSQMKCISIRNLNDLIEWSKERSGERK